MGEDAIENSPRDPAADEGLSSSFATPQSRAVHGYNEARVTVPASTVSKLCTYCQKLALDILSSPARPCPGWEVLQARKYLMRHHNGLVRSLRQSAKNGCDICVLMAGQAPEIDQFESAKYRIFVWKRSVANAEFSLAFIEDQPQSPEYLVSFSFFRGIGSDSGWHSTRIRPKAEWPALPVLNRMPNLAPKSAEALSLAKQWLFDCLTHHQNCCRPKSTLPKRVLDLRSLSGIDEISLYESTGESAAYVALSYSWGNALPLKTTRGNIDAHRTGNFGNLPLVLKDAVFITRQLNIRYLWIDALCIIQDDNTDWVEQAAAMTNIYQGATLSIAASSSRDCNDGFLRDLSDSSLQIGTYQLQSGQASQRDIFLRRLSHKLNMDMKPLSSRAWAFQERLVSKATLHCTDEGMVWECACRIRLQHNQTYDYNQFQWKSAWDGLLHRQGSSFAPDPFKFWNSIITEFSKRELTYIEDKLPALAGVAEHFSRHFGLEYVAGLWKSNLKLGLLWTRHRDTRTLVRPSKYLAPTWSWASVKGQVEYPTGDIVEFAVEEEDMIIHECEIDEEFSGSFGRVKHGSIRAEGSLQFVTIDTSRAFGVEPQWRTRCLLDECDIFTRSGTTLITCWCLKVGTQQRASNCITTLFLLLKKIEGQNNVFERIGIADTTSGPTEVYRDHSSFISHECIRMTFTLV